MFAQTCVQAKNKRIKHTLCVIKPSARLTKGEGACGNFAYYSMLIILSWPPKGGHGPIDPSKYAPDDEVSLEKELSDIKMFVEEN